MPQTHVQHFAHIVFSTKFREPLLFPPIDAELHNYIAGLCNDKECTPVIVGGFTDHIHILCYHSKKIALMDLVKHVKSNSSKWIKTQGEAYQNFQWQIGYGSFCVDHTRLEQVKTYIANQKQHHGEMTFQTEYLAFLKKYNVPYDERFMWD